jgi:Na+/proline symporter
MLPISKSEAGAGLVPPAVAVEMLGNTGAALILVMLFMAIVSTGSAEAIAVSSLVAYDIYREYINPDATGEQILYVSRVVIVVFGLIMGCFALLLYEIGVVRTMIIDSPSTCLSPDNTSRSSFLILRTSDGCTFSWVSSSDRPCALSGT